MKYLLYAIIFVFFPGFLGAQSSIDSLPQLHDYESQRASSYDRSGGNADYRSLKPGETLAIFDEDGPGEIRHIWTTLPPWSEAYHLKKVVLRMYWDGEAQPSVEAPIGDFFGLGLGTYTTFQSALLAVAPDQALNSYFPMPFGKHGRITVTNEGSKEITDYYWNIDWIKPASLDPGVAYFHAQYRQCAPCQGWYRGISTAMIFRKLAKTRAGSTNLAKAITSFLRPLATDNWPVWLSRFSRTSGADGTKAMR
jgi:hypothetical protein